MVITSLQNNLVKQMTKLHQKKYRDEMGMFFVEGYHLYEEAVKAGDIVYVFTTDESIVGDNVHYVNITVLEKLAKTKQPQPVLTVCKKQESTVVGDNVLLLEYVQDPGNLGTLMRSALAFGFTTIVLDQTVDVYNDKVLRSTQGAIFKLHIIHQDIATFMSEHKDIVYYGTEMFGSDLLTISSPKKVGLILGNEGAGVSDQILQKTSANITIKMEETESLNVAVAGSIIMHHLSVNKDK